MILLYYGTGMRLSEVRLLLWENVNFEDGIIWVRKGKGAKDRVVMLAEGLGEKLKVYRGMQRPTQEYVFEGKTPGEPIAPKTIQGAIIIARRKANLPDWVSAHVLRHSFVTASLKNGADLLTLKELLGHIKLHTTSRYLHLNLQHFKNTYNPIENPCLDVAFVTKPIVKDSSQLFLLTRPDQKITIRAGPGRLKHKTLVIF